MKKVLLILLASLMSCKTVETKVQQKSIESNKTCESYEFTPQFIYEFDYIPNHNQDQNYNPFFYGIYLNKALTKDYYYKEKIKVYINTSLLVQNKIIKELIEINNSNISNLKLPKVDEGDLGNIGRINIKTVDKQNDIHISFISNTLIGIFENSCELDHFSNLYKSNYSKKIMNGHIDKKILFNYLELKPDLSKIDVKDYIYLFDKYNQSFLGDVKEMEFSSVNTLKLFLIYLDYSLNYQGKYRNLALSLIDF